VFTGIVEELGAVVALDRVGDSARLRVHGPAVIADARPGDSIAVNGVCLTVTRTSDGSFTADVMHETLARTSLSVLGVGDPVNLERAVRADGRLGGHLVQGHVDAVGRIERREPGERWEVLRVSVPPALSRYVVPKGSIAVDGVSLTVVEADSDGFTVSLIPETLSRTTLGHAPVGAPVNLEVDVLAKYVERMVEAHLASAEDRS
jgi:riboflavin synthase